MYSVSNLGSETYVELELPESIDLSAVDLRDLGTPMKSFNNQESTYSNEYSNEINDILIKSNIMNIVTIIHDTIDSEDKTNVHQLYNILKNTLIINSRALNTMPNFTKEIDNYLTLIAVDYNRLLIHKMLSNIRNNIDNKQFREIGYGTSNIPPMSIEERIIIESKLPQFRKVRQFKKNQAPFNVDEIVGAKDKENKWWLARVLHRFDTPESADFWYYVRFENQDAIHDEWICSKTYRVRHFNPRKHFLKRRHVVDSV